MLIVLFQTLKNAGLWIRIGSIRIQKFSSIRIHNVIESGSNPDPQQYRTLEDKYFQRLKNQQKKSEILAVCTIFIPFRYKNK
jgi:hypothetical protein